MNWDNSILKVEQVIEGGDATPPENPTRPDDADYSYTFTGWNGVYTNVTSNRTITAEYSATPLSNILPSTKGYNVSQKLDTTTVTYEEEQESVTINDYDVNLESKFAIEYDGSDAIEPPVTTITSNVPKNKITGIRYSNLNAIEWSSKDDRTKTFTAGNVNEDVYTQIIDTTGIASDNDYNTFELRFRNTTQSEAGIKTGILEMGWTDKKVQLFPESGGQSFIVSEATPQLTVTYGKTSSTNGSYTLASTEAIAVTAEPIATITLKLPLNQNIEVYQTALAGTSEQWYGEGDTVFYTQTPASGIPKKYRLNSSSFKNMGTYNEVTMRMTVLSELANLNSTITISYV